MKNDRDVLLFGNQIYAVPPDRAVVLTPSTGLFQLAADGSSKGQTSYLLTPLLLGGLVGTVTYAASAGLTLTYSGSTATLSLANMTVDYGYVTASVVMDGITFTSAPVVFNKSRDGASGTTAKSLRMLATSQVFATNKAGTTAPTSITLTAVQQGLAGTPSWTVPSGGATLAIGSDGYNKVLTFANTAADSVQIRVDQDGLFDTMTINKLREGVDGISATVPQLTNELAGLSADSSGAPLSLAGASTNIKVYVGIVDDTANWTFTTSPASSAASLSYTLSANGASGGLVTVTGMAAATSLAYIDITPTKNGVSLPAQRFTVMKVNAGATGVGTPGARGAGWFYGTGSAWSDAVADAATPGANVADDVVTISNAAGTYVLTKRWNGSAWVAQGQVLDGALAVTGSFAAAAIDTRGLTVKALDGSVLLGVGVPLSPSLAAAGTRNADLAPIVSNLFINSLPYSIGNFAAGSTLAAGAWSGPVFAAVSPYTPRNKSCVYVTAAGTPAAGQIIDLYDNLNTPPRMDVVAGDCYEFSAALSTHRCIGYVVVVFFSSTGANLGAFEGNQLLNNGARYDNTFGDDFPRSLVFAVAPAGAVKVMFSVRLLALGGFDTPYVFASEFYTGRASKTQTVGTKYTEFSATGLSASLAANKVTADAAKAFADAVSNDGVLDRSEKAQLVGKWLAIDAEWARLIPQATAMGVSSVAYNAAHQALSDYLISINPSWSDTSTDSAIVRVTFNSKFTAYADAWQALQNDLNTKNAAAAAAAVDLNLVARGSVALFGNTATKTSGASAWDSDVYSKEGYVGGALAQAAVPNANAYGIMFGLSTNPTVSGSFDTINYAVYITGAGTAQVFESGSQVTGVSVALTNGDVLAVAYDGSNVRYLRNGTVFRTVTVAITVPLYFDSSFATPGAVLSNIRFVPMSSNAWLSIGGLGKPENYATNGATFGPNGNIGGQMTVAQVPNFIPANGVTDALIGGNLKSSNWVGDTGVGGVGWLAERDTGNFYMNNLKARGALMGGGFTGYAWPANGGGGFYVGPQGILLGNNGPNGAGGFFDLNSNGELSMPGFSYVARQLTLTNTILYNPTVGANISATVSPTGNSYTYSNNIQYTGTYIGSYTASMSSGSGNYAYTWAVNCASSSFSVVIYTNPHAAQVQLSATFKVISQSADVYLTCTVTDLNSNVSKTATALITLVVGS